MASKWNWRSKGRGSEVTWELGRTLRAAPALRCVSIMQWTLLLKRTGPGRRRWAAVHCTCTQHKWASLLPAHAWHAKWPDDMCTWGHSRAPQWSAQLFAVFIYDLLRRVSHFLCLVSGHVTGTGFGWPATHVRLDAEMRRIWEGNADMSSSQKHPPVQDRSGCFQNKVWMWMWWLNTPEMA